MLFAEWIEDAVLCPPSHVSLSVAPSFVRSASKWTQKFMQLMDQSGGFQLLVRSRHLAVRLSSLDVELRADAMGYACDDENT